MTAMAHEPLSQEELLLEGFLALDTPEGYLAEFIEGDSVVTPPPDGEHEDYIGLLVEQVAARAGTRTRFSGNKGLRLPRGGWCTENYAIPDGTWAAKDRRLFREAGSWMPCDGVAMVAEVTSARAERDRTAKRHCYARGGVPHYLLVDREKSAMTLLSEPAQDDYRQVVTIPFGKEIELPAPFSMTLDTMDFA